MSTLIYNGITLEVVKTNSIIQQPVYSEDGRYLYTKYTIDIDAIYNPKATSYISNDVQIPYQAALPPNKTEGIDAPITDIAIRSRLMVPRGKLYYKAASSNWIAPGNVAWTIESPKKDGNIDRIVDAAGGPKPIAVVIAPFPNTKTWRINYQIETYINDCPNRVTGSSSVPKVLLSNSWSQKHDVLPDRRTRIETSGRALFDIGALKSLGFQADWFRGGILPGIPLNFRREMVSVTISPDGSTIHWSVVDEEQFRNVGSTIDQNYGVVDFDASLTLSTVRAGGNQGNGMGIASPLTAVQSAVVVRGDLNSRRAELIAWATKLGWSKLLNGKINGNANTILVSDLTISEDVGSPVVRVTIQAFALPPNDQIVVDADFFFPHEFLGVDDPLDKNGVPIFATDGTNNNLPNASNTRGYYIGSLIAQDLKASCSESVSGPKTLTCDPWANSFQWMTYMDGQDTLTDTIIGDCRTQISVQVSPVPPRSTQYFPQGGVSHYRIDTTFSVDSGTYLSPIASHGGIVPSEYGSYTSAGASAPASIPVPDGYRGFSALPVTVHAPISYRIVEWSAERWGTPPPLPDPRTIDDEVLLLTDVTPTAPMLAKDGNTLIYAISGVYVYGRIDGRGAGNTTVMGVMPNVKLTYEDLASRVGPQNYFTGLVTPTNLGGSPI